MAYEIESHAGTMYIVVDPDTGHRHACDGADDGAAIAEAAAVYQPDGPKGRPGRP
jgi:hypothetical protein